MKLTIIIPCYNEKIYILGVVSKILKVKLENVKKEIILVDDGSVDGTNKLIKKHLRNKIIKIIFHKENRGKGAAIRSAIPFIKGNIVLIQDADYEYNPIDYKKLINPIINQKASVVYGSRTLGKKRYSAKGFISFTRVFFNHFLTVFSNILNNQKLTDAHTCYKVFKKDVFLKLNLSENDFAFCPEVNTKVSKMGIKILEVPISYTGRSKQEGKKINIFDGLRALYVLIKYRFYY
jgi:dolichol-phosphate mannosyltransferase